MRDPYHIVKSVRITEKGTALAEKHNQYVLKVAPARPSRRSSTR
jgi:ribosomal protein L23